MALCLAGNPGMTGSSGVVSRSASHQLFPHGLMDGPHNRLEAQVTSKRAVGMDVPGIRQRSIVSPTNSASS